MLKILISGGSGVLGQALIKELKRKGHQIQVLTRGDSKDKEYIYWNPTAGEIDLDKIVAPDAVIHLAGANVASQRWTKKRKKEILDSRVSAAAFLFNALSKSGKLPNLYLTASGINYYGWLGDKICDERTEKGDSFLAKVCIDWESVAGLFQNKGIRTVALRTGVVMGPQGTALQEMTQTFRFGIAGIPGNGKQIVSWIWINDWVKAVTFIIDNKACKGPFNLTAPHPCNLGELLSAAQKAKNARLLRVPAPGFLLKLVLGKRAEIVLESLTVAPEKLLQLGFVFEAERIDQAMAKIYGKS